METFEVIYVPWYYHDRWSGNEDNGSSLHINLSDFEKYHQRYLSKLTNLELENWHNIPRKPQKALVSFELYQRLCGADLGLNLSEEEDKLLIKEGKIIL